MTSSVERPDDIGPLIDQLSQGVEGIDKDDLVGLAKLHGLCEALADATRPQAAYPDETLFRAAGVMAHTLETLILGDTQNPEQAFASIIESVTEIAGGGSISCLQPADSSVKTPQSDEEIAARLAKIYDDESVAPPADKRPTAGGPTDALHGHDAGEGTGGGMGRSNAQIPPRPPAPCEPPYESVPLRIDKKEEEFVRAFLEEAAEHVEAVEAALLEVERSPDDAAQIDALFRPFHTIKGMAGFLNLRDINSLTHEVETLLDQARKGKRGITPGLIDLVFNVVDILKVQISSIRSWMNNPKADVVPQPPVTDMIAFLRDVVAGRAEPEAHRPVGGTPGQRIGEDLVEQGVCPKEVVEFALDRQKTEGGGARTGEILIELGVATPKQVSRALRQQGDVQGTAVPATTAGAAGEQSVRIDTAKLDALVDMVGELVIAQTQVSANPRVACDAKLTKDVNQVSKIIRDAQQVAMGMRMIPIGGTFQKMARLVRDVSHKAHKQVELIISGEDTELDKNVIQQIGDPLVHMVRNAVDHGIESPDVRRAAGKTEVGRVHLSAFHHGGNIVIRISDDGKGLDPKALVAKGIERGIIQAGEELTDQQAYQLVFAPGFSLAAQVTDISGRGVGMDVVKRNIDRLRGRVEISSEVGKGTTFSIHLPLTLAIIDGMIVRAGAQRFIIQTIVIEQSLRPQRNRITTVQHKGEVLEVRGRLVPLIQLGALFGLTGRIDPCNAMVVVAQYEDQKIGLIVEELIGQQQVVIKSLGERFKDLRGIAGAAILGDGRVGLILEMSGLLSAHSTAQMALSSTTTVDGSAADGFVPEPFDVQCASDMPTEAEAALTPA